MSDCFTNYLGLNSLYGAKSDKRCFFVKRKPEVYQMVKFVDNESIALQKTDMIEFPTLTMISCTTLGSFSRIASLFEISQTHLA